MSYKVTLEFESEEQYKKANGALLEAYSITRVLSEDDSLAFNEKSKGITDNLEYLWTAFDQHEYKSLSVKSLNLIK
jgi:hypothetical protein